MDQATFPACFTELRFYRNWQRTMPHCPDKLRATICTDCTPQYQLRMKRHGRCSNPEATIRFDAEGNVTGVGTR